MILKKNYYILLLLTALSTSFVQAQVTIKGTVYDSSGLYAVQSVSVLTSRGTGTITNANGDYQITVAENDSIWFSYLNKPTRKFPVKTIKNPFAFDISLQTSIVILPETKVRNRYYREDSLKNRQEYAKVFNYQKPGLRVSSLSDGTVGFDLDAIINSFRFRKNRNMQAFQDRLISQEQEAFIRHRFSKSLIRRITQLKDDSTINHFIVLYQPSYLFTSLASDYVFHKYIKDSYERFKNGLMPPPLWRDGETSTEQYGNGNFSYK